MDYEGLSEDAYGLLDEFGSNIILKKKTGSVYDKPSMKYITTYSEHTGKAVMSQYSAEAIGDSNIINAGDSRFTAIFDDKTIVPIENEDKIIFGNIQYSVLHVNTVSPDGNTVIVYKIHARRT